MTDAKRTSPEKDYRTEEFIVRLDGSVTVTPDDRDEWIRFYVLENRREIRRAKKFGLDVRKVNSKDHPQFFADDVIRQIGDFDFTAPDAWDF